jgi:hypothetical protein
MTQNASGEASSTDEWRILHAFADTGVECEMLHGYGRVTRLGIDAEDNPYTDELIVADAHDADKHLSGRFDLGLFHPPCQSWTPGAQQHGTTDDHPDLIPLAREIARDYCDEWIIENVPQAPLSDPVVLNGGMFGLPLHYERAFETSYHVAQPRRQTRLTEHETFDKHHDTGGWHGDMNIWKSVKGYSGSWLAKPFKRCAIPRPYLNYILRPLL